MKSTPVQVAAQAVQLILSLVLLTHLTYAQGLYPQASTRLLESSDLEGKSKLELKIMRNEIFARYGYMFKTDDMKKHFGAQSWYRPSAADVSSRLTQIEKKNIEFIKQYEQGASTPTSNGKLEYNGRAVLKVVPYVDGGLMAGATTGFAVIALKDQQSSWVVVPIDLAEKIEVPFDHDADWSDANKQFDEQIHALSAKDILESINGDPVLTGKGKLPILSGSPGGEGEIGEATLEGKIAGLWREKESYWGDFRLGILPSRTFSAPVKMPSKQSPGRLDDAIISEVLNVESIGAGKATKRGIWFINADGMHTFYSANGNFFYTPPSGKVVKYVAVGSAAFAVLVNENGTNSWILYTSESSDGRKLPIDPSFTLKAEIHSCDNDVDDFCSVFSVFKGRDLRHVVSMDPFGMYTFPKGTAQKDGDYSFTIPGKGTLIVGDCEGIQLRLVNEQEEEVSLDEFLEQ